MSNDATEFFMLQGRLVGVARSLCALPIGSVERSAALDELNEVCGKIGEHAPLDLDSRTSCLMRWLHAHAFETTARGSEKSEAERVNVIIVVEPDDAPGEAVRLRVLLAEHGIQTVPYGDDLEAPYILQTFDPSDGSAIVELANVDDQLLFGMP